MPSGHVLNAVTLLVWLLLEISTCYDAAGLAAASSDGPAPSRLAYVLVVIMIYAPVPWSRWYTYDHTWKQVVYTAIASIFIGVLCWVVRFLCFADGSRAPWNGCSRTTQPACDVRNWRNGRSPGDLVGSSGRRTRQTWACHFRDGLQ